MGINISGIFDVYLWQPTHPIYIICWSLPQSVMWDAVNWSSGKTYPLKMSYSSASAKELRACQKNIPQTCTFKAGNLQKKGMSGVWPDMNNVKHNSN